MKPKIFPDKEAPPSTGGVLVTAAGPKYRPFVRQIALQLAYLMAALAIAPPGAIANPFESPQAETLRVLTADEAAGVKSGLEQALMGSDPLSVVETAAPAANSSFWETRNGPSVNFTSRSEPVRTPVVETPGPASIGSVAASGLEQLPNRRDVNKLIAATAAAAVLPSVAAGQAPPNRPIQQFPEAVAPAGDRALGFLASGEPNGVWSKMGGDVYTGEPVIREPRGMRYPLSIEQGFLDELSNFISTGRDQFLRLMGWDRRVSTPAQVRRNWTPTPFTHASARKQSYVIWYPWTLSEGEQLELFAGIQKGAGERAAQPGFHSRVYVDPYGILRSDRIWSAIEYARFRERARAFGVEVVPLMGHELMAVDPDGAIYQLRQLEDTGILYGDQDPERGRMVRFAYDIEPRQLRIYREAEEAYEKARQAGDVDGMRFHAQTVQAAWRNILSIPERTQDILKRSLQQQALPGGLDVEVVLFVPPDFTRIVDEFDLEVPDGVHLVFMNYADSPERMAENAETIANAFAGFDERGRPDDQLRKNLNGFDPATNPAGATFSIMAEIGPTDHAPSGAYTLQGVRHPADTLWGEGLGGRVAEAGRQVGDALRAAGPAFNGEFGIEGPHPDFLVRFLEQGDFTREEVGDISLQKYLAEARKTAKDAALYLAAQALYKDVARYGTIPNGKSLDEYGVLGIQHLAQRGAAGAVGSGSVWGHWRTLVDSIRDAQWRLHGNTPVFGPDLGTGWMAYLWARASRYYGAGAITETRRIVVDPSSAGEELNLPPGTVVRGVRNPVTGFIRVTGEVDHKAAPGKLITVQAGDIVTGTKLPNGAIVPGRIVPEESGILADGSTPERQIRDLEITQLPSGGYDIYWLVDVHNPKSSPRPFRGHIRMYPLTGYGDPEELVEPGGDIEVPSGETATIQLSLLTGYTRVEGDVNGRLVDERARTDPDPYKRRGRLDPQAIVWENIQLIDSQAQTMAGEVADAVGAAYHYGTLVDLLRGYQPARQELADRLGEAVQANQLSTLVPYALDRDLSVRLRMNRTDDPTALLASLDLPGVPNASTLKDRHGVRTLIVESEDLMDLVRDFRILRRGVFIMPGSIQEAEIHTALTEPIEQDTGRRSAAYRLRRLLQEAKKRGLRVAFLVDGRAAQQPATDREGRPLDLPHEDWGNTWAQDFFGVLKSLTESEILKIDWTTFTVLDNWESLGRSNPDDLGEISILYGNAQAPLVFLSDTDQPYEVAPGLKVDCVQDLTGERNPEPALAAGREAASREGRPLGDGLLTLGQLKGARTLGRADVPALLGLLLGRANALQDSLWREAVDQAALLLGEAPEGVDKTWMVGGLLSADLLQERYNRPWKYQTPIERALIAALRMRKATPFSTGMFSLAADQMAPDLPGRTHAEFSIRSRVYSERARRLAASEYSSRDVNLRQPLDFSVSDLDRGAHSVSFRVSARGYAVIASEPTHSAVPFVTISDDSLTLYGDPSRPAGERKFDAGRGDEVVPLNAGARERVVVGSHPVRFELGDPVELTVTRTAEGKGSNQLRIMEEHRIVTIGGQKLHFGRVAARFEQEGARYRLVYWVEGVDGEPVGGIREMGVYIDSPIGPGWLSTRNLSVGNADVQLQAEPSQGRVRLRIEGRIVELWEISDQERVSTWRFGWPSVGTAGGVQLVITPGKQRVMDTTASRISNGQFVAPKLAEEFDPRFEPRADDPIPPDPVGAQTGRLLGRLALGTAAVVAAKSVWDRINTGWETAKGEVLTPQRSDLTRKPVWTFNPTHWGKPAWRFLKITAVTLAALYLLAIFPPTAALLGVGGTGFFGFLGHLPGVTFLAAKFASLPVLGVIGTALAGTGTFAGTFGSFAVKLTAGLLILRWVVDGLGGLPFVTGMANWPNQLYSLLSSRLPATSDDAQEALVTPLALLVLAGRVLRQAADTGRWVGMGVLAIGFVSFPIVPTVWLGAAAVGVAAPTIPLWSALWLCGGSVGLMTVQGVTFFVGGVLGLNVLVYLIRTGWLNAEGNRILDFNWRQVLAGPVLDGAVGALVLGVAVAVFFPAAFGFAAAAQLTVMEALKIYVVYRALYGLSRFTAQTSFPGIAFAVTAYAVAGMLLGSVSWLAAMGWAALAGTVAGVLVFQIWARLHLPHIGHAPAAPEGASRAVRAGYAVLGVVLSPQLWTVLLAVPLALGPLKALVAAIQPAGAISLWLAQTFNPQVAHAITGFLISGKPLGVAAAAFGVYLTAQHLAALRSRILWPVLRWVRGAPEGVQTPTPPALPSAAPEPVVLPPGEPETSGPEGDSQAGLEGVFAPGRSSVTAQEAARVEAMVTQLANQALESAGFSQTLSQLAASSDPAHQALAEELANGFLVMTQPARQVTGLDISAFMKDGPTHLDLAQIGAWLEEVPELKGINANIDVDPAGNPNFFSSRNYFNYAGFGVTVFPVLWGSQKIQYSVAMISRKARGALSDPVGVVFLFGSGIHSDMEDNPEAFISQVMGRWLEGHRSIIATMAGGQTFHLDPNRQLFSPVRLFGKQWQQYDFLEHQAPADPVSRAAANYIAEGDDQNYDLYGMERGMPPRGLQHQPFRTSGQPESDNDREALQTRQLPSGQWVMSPRGVERNSPRLLFAPIQFRVRGGRLERGSIGRWSVVYREEGDLPTVRAFSKSAALSGSMEMLQGRAVVSAGSISEDGQVAWTVTPLDEANDAAHGLQPYEQMEVIAHDQKRRGRSHARTLYIQNARHLGSDGVWYAPEELDRMPAGVVDLGPRLGHKPFESAAPYRSGWFGDRFGMLYQTGIRFADIWTGRFISSADSWADFGRLIASGNIGPALQSLPYLLGGLFPLMLAGAAAYLVFGLGMSPLLFLIPLATSSWFIEWFGRRPHAVSYWGLRKHPINASIQAYYHPDELLRMAEAVAGRIGRLPEAYQSDAAYQQLVQQGQAVLDRPVQTRSGRRLLEVLQGDGAGTIADLVAQYARTPSPEQRLAHRNQSASAWLMELRGAIVAELRAQPEGILPGRFALGRLNPFRAPPEARVAVQHAMLQGMRHEQLAVGNRGARYAYVGAHNVNIQRRGDHTRDYATAWSEPDELAAGELLNRMGYNPQEFGAPDYLALGREWAWMDPARKNLDPLRVSADPERSMGGLEASAPAAVEIGPRAGSSFFEAHFNGSYTMPDTDDQVRAAGQVSVSGMPLLARVLGTPDLRHGGMVRLGPDPRHLGGFGGALAAGTAVAAGKAGLLSALFGVSLPTGGALTGLIAAAIGGDYLLHQTAHLVDHWADALPVAWRGNRVVRVTQGVYRFLNRLVGAAASILIGVGLGYGAYGAITAAAAGWGIFAFAGVPVALAAVVLIGLASINAAFAAVMTYREDAYGNHGWPGEGVRAISRIPGTLIQTPLLYLYKLTTSLLRVSNPTVVAVAVGGLLFALPALGGLGLLPAALSGLAGLGTGGILLRAIGAGLLVWAGKRFNLFELPWSWDAVVASAANGVPPGSLAGLVDDLEYPIVAGPLAFFWPGKWLGRLPVGFQIYSKMEATPVPYAKVQMLSFEPAWTRELSGLNLLPHTARIASLGLAEDSLASWAWEVVGYEGEPVVAAFGAVDLDHQQAMHEEYRDDAGAFQRAMQFAKGAGMWLAILQMTERDHMETDAAGGYLDLRNLVQESFQADPEERLRIFGSVLWFLLQREQADTGEAGGAGAYSFLATSFTASQLANKLVGMFAPGEAQALARFLHYMARDEEMGGAIARQIFQMNHEQAGNPLSEVAYSVFPEHGTLGDREVLELLLGESGFGVPFFRQIGATGGWAVDPRAAIALAKEARRNHWWAVRRATETLNVRNVFARTISAFTNKARMVRIGAFSRHRKVVNDLHRMGKNYFIRMRTDWNGTQPAKMVLKEPVNAVRSARRVERERARLLREARGRAAHREDFAVRYGPFQGGEGGQPVEPPPILPDEAPTAPSPRETTYEPRPNADQPPIEVTPEDIVPLEESGPPVTPFDEETDWLNQPQPRRENEQNQAGLEAGRRDFLKQAVAGLAVTGAVSLASGDLAAQPPAAAPAQGTVPPAAVPAVGGYIDAQRRIEGEMLRLHADISASRVDLFEREAVRQVAVRLRDAQAISQHELDSYLLLLEQRPVASAYARLMDLHRELIRSDGSDRDGRWAAYAAALDAHIRAEESNLRENIAFMDRAIPVVQGLAERKILTADEVEPFIAVRDKSRLLLGKFSHQRAIYRILYRLRTQLPLAQIPQPADLARNILVALPTFLPATDPQAREGLPYGERRKLRLQMREEVAALLELEQQIYSIEIELWRRQVDRKEDLARQSPGAVTRTELGLGRMLLKRADLYQALQEFLRAQAHLALQEDRRDEVAAQERVDQEVMALMQALEGFESGWVQFWREEQTRIALSNAQVPGAVPQWEIREARAEELLAQRRVEKVQAVQRAYPHLQALGLPLGPLEGTTPRALAFDPKNLLPDYSSSTAVFYPGKTVTEYALPSGPTSGIDITPLGISKGPVKKTASGASYRDITYASITEHRRNPLTAPSIGPAGSGLLPAEAMVAAPIVGVDQPLTPGEVEAHVEAIEQVEADLARIKVAEIQHLIDLANYRAATIDELYAKHVEPLWKQQDIAHERRKGAVLGVWQEVILAEIEVMHAQTEQEFTAAVGRLDFLNQRRTEVEISRTDDRIHVLRSRLAQMRANPGPYGQLAIDKTAAEQALLQIHRRELGRQQDWYAALSDEGIPMVLPETAQAIPPTPSLMDRMDLEEEVQLFGYVWELRAEGRWELVPVSSPGWMYLARPTLAEFQNRIAWRLGAYIWDEEIGRYKMKNRVVKLQADLSAHPQINPSGRTSHATVKVAWDGFWSQREGKSGWYYVLGDRVIKLRPTQAGVIPLAEKPTAGTSPFEGREALILFAVGSVEQIGENDLEHAFNPIGVLEFRVPLSSYTNDLPEHPERIVREFLASGKTLPNGRKVYGTFRRAQKVHWDSAVEPGQLLTTDVIHGPSGGEPVWQEPVFVQMEIPGTKRLVWDGEIRLRDVSGDELAARAGERESAEAGPPQDAAAVREALEAAVRQGTAVAGTQSGLEAGPPQPFSSLADPGSAAPSKVRESEGVGPSVSPAAARPEGGQGAAAGRLSAGGLEELQPPMAPVVAVAGVGIAARVEFLQGRIYGPDLEDSMTARVELRTLQESAARSAVAGWLEISAEPAALEQAVVFHLDTVETAGFAPGILLGGGSVAVLTDTLTQAAGLNELIADLERETGRPGLTDRLIVRSEEEFGGDRAAALGALAGAIPAGVTVERVPPASTLEAVEQLLARYGLTFQSGGLEAATRATTDYLESLA